MVDVAHDSQKMTLAGEVKRDKRSKRGHDCGEPHREPEDKLGKAYRPHHHTEVDLIQIATPTSTSPTTKIMEFKNLDDSQVKTLGKCQMQNVSIKGIQITRITIKPGGGWSIDLKEADGTDSCMKNHRGVMISGTLAVKMNDGTEKHFKAGDVANVPAGHDSWCVGDEPAVWLECRMGEN